MKLQIQTQRSVETIIDIIPLPFYKIMDYPRKMLDRVIKIVNPDVAEKNISAEDYLYHTSVYDKSQGSALDKIKDADDLITNGEVDHSKFYGYAGEFEVADYSRPEVKEECSEGIDGEEICEEVTYYPHEKTEKGVSLNSEVDVLRQAVYELKTELCKHDESYNFC